jgi:peroxiredoxin (alkyl hydroperoxide reductase subunit C)
MLNLNDIIPDRVVDAFHNGAVTTLRLSDFRGRWLVLLFYPADFTFVCPTELQAAARRYDEFRLAGAELMSVSTDAAFIHKAWHEESAAVKEVRFPMIADPTGVLCREFGTFMPDEGLSQRATYIIDPTGRVRAFEYHDSSIGRSVDEIYRKFEAARYVTEHPHELCPAGWRPGDHTLVPSVQPSAR